MRGDEMKMPEVKDCPCCGIELRREPQASAFESTVVPVSMARLCKIENNVIETNEDALRLFWKCVDCGFLWEHGGFSQ